MAKRRKSSAKAYTYTDGIVHGWVGEITAPPAPLLQAAMAVVPDWAASYRNKAVLQITNNGKVWSYALRSLVQPMTVGHEVKFAGQYIPADSKTHAAPTLDRLESAYRAPFEWAKRDLLKRAKLPSDAPGALAFNCAYEQEAPRDAIVSLPGPRGPITYNGIARKVGAYTIEALHEIISKAVADCAAVWTWRSEGAPPWIPNRLEVMLHSGKRALGLAFAPGSGREPPNKRVISLNKVLLEQYDASSIWRTTVHEICHHYRDEVFARHEVDPAERESLLQTVKAHVAGKGHRTVSLWEKVLNTHDATFVRELGRVDPGVKDNLISAMVFTEYADPSLVAELTAKREARKAAAASKVSWAPTDGRLYFDRLPRSGGVFNVWWIPLVDGRWRPVRERLNNPQMSELIKRLGPDWRKTAVTYSDQWPSNWSRPETLDKAVSLLEYLLGMYIRENHT